MRAGTESGLRKGRVGGERGVAACWVHEGERAPAAEREREEHELERPLVC